MQIHDLVFSADLAGLKTALNADPSLASKEIPLPDNPATAHPLHRVCDGVFYSLYSEQTGIEIAEIFMKYGAKVNGEARPGKDSPLTAACSLHCDRLALLYIERGADINHQGCLGGTALHWASWCGRDAVVSYLVKLVPDINKLCIDFKSTPLFWAMHGYKFGGKDNRNHQVECVKILLDHGADKTIPNFEGYFPWQLANAEDQELIELLKFQDRSI